MKLLKEAYINERTQWAISAVDSEIILLSAQRRFIYALAHVSLLAE